MKINILISLLYYVLVNAKYNGPNEPIEDNELNIAFQEFLNTYCESNDKFTTYDLYFLLSKAHCF